MLATNTAIVQEAREYARRVHEGQMYGDQPYFTHLQEVTHLLRHEFATPCDANTICAGWLHDAVEDTKGDKDEALGAIKARFGADIASLVWACTGIGGSRMLRNIVIGAKLIHSPRAARVKLADRVCNVESCWKNTDTRLYMYQKEHSTFRTTLLAADVTLRDEPLFKRLDVLMGHPA